MMRRGAISIGVLLLIGCASKPKPTQHARDPKPIYQESRATALAFDPPVMLAEAPLDLSREGREPSAFLGYDDLISTYFYIRTDDRYTLDNTGRFERRAIIEKTGARFR